ncbi:unnamed protein product [Scytosiphon promiscuus]
MLGVLSRSFLEEVVHNSGWSIAEVERLSLAGEGISSLEGGCPFEGARRLVYLDLSRNHLSSLRGVEHLTSLGTLILRENRVDSIDEVGRLARLSNLRNLDLRLNPVVSGIIIPSSQNHVVGGSERSRSSGGGSSNGSSQSRNWNSNSSSNSSRKIRTTIVSAVPQLESLNGRRVLDNERPSPRKQRPLRRSSHDPGGEDEHDVIHMRQYTQRHGQGRQQLQQEQPQSRPPSNPQDRRHRFQHQNQSQCQPRLPGEHGKRPDSPTLVPPLRIADDAGTRQPVRDDEELRMPGRPRGSDESEVRKGARDSSNDACQAEDAATSRSHHPKRKPSIESSRRLKNSGEVAGEDDFSCFFPARTSVLAPANANRSSNHDVHGQRRVAYAVHAHRDLSVPGQRSYATSPTRRDSSSREPVVYLLDDEDYDSLVKDNDVDHGVGFVQQTRDSRVLGAGADKNAPASPGPSAFQPPAAAVVGGMSRGLGRQGAEDMAGAVIASRSCGSKGVASRSSTARRECANGKATHGGDGTAPPKCRDGGPRETPSVAEQRFDGAGGKDPKATPRRPPPPPPPPLSSQDAGDGAAWPSVAGVSVAAPSARGSEAPVKGSGGDAVFDSGDGADGDLAALWRELQGVEESPCGSESGSRGQDPLTLSLLSSTSHACASPIAPSTTAPTSTARITTAKTARTRKPESSGAARAVEAFRRSSKRLGLLPAPVPVVPGGDGSGGGGYEELARCGTDTHENRRCDGRVASGANDPFLEAENIAAPVRASSARTPVGFDRSDGDPEFESTGNGNGGGSGSPIDSDRGGNCQGRGHDAHNATFVRTPASTSPPRTVSSAAAYVERALPTAKVATDTSEADLESPMTGPAKTSGPVASAMEPTADAPTTPRSSKPSTGDLPASGTSTAETARRCIAPHARERFAGGCLEEGCVAGARAWDEAPDAATAGVTGGDSTEAVEERWRAREREFALRWTAREREFEERWAAREREIEHRRREDFSQGFTAEMRSMLLGAHEALISSNAWLVERLKTLEAAVATGASGAHTPGLSEARPESTTAPRPGPANVNPASTTGSEIISTASLRRRPATEGRKTVSLSSRPGCRSGTGKVDEADGGTPSLGDLGRATSSVADGRAVATGAEAYPSSSSSCTSHPVRGVVGVDADASHGTFVHRASSETVATASGEAVSVQSRRREGEGMDDRGPQVRPATSAAATVASDIRAAMVGYEELLRSRRRNIDGSIPCGVESGGVKEVAGTASNVRAPLRPASRSSEFVDQGSAVAVAVETAAAASSSRPKKDSREPCVEGPREDGVSLSRPAAVAAVSSCPVEGAVNTTAGAAPLLGASLPSIVMAEGLIEASCGVDSNHDGGEFGIDPEVTVSTAPSH